MTITVNTESSEGFRHSIQVDDHQLLTCPSTPVAKAPPPSPMTTSMPP